MTRLLTMVFVLMTLILLGFIGYLAVWDMPAPSSRVEKIIPNDRFPD